VGVDRRLSEIFSLLSGLCKKAGPRLPPTCSPGRVVAPPMGALLIFFSERFVRELPFPSPRCCGLQLLPFPNSLVPLRLSSSNPHCVSPTPFLLSYKVSSFQVPRFLYLILIFHLSTARPPPLVWLTGFPFPFKPSPFIFTRSVLTQPSNELQAEGHFPGTKIPTKIRPSQVGRFFPLFPSPLRPKLLTMLLKLPLFPYIASPPLYILSLLFRQTAKASVPKFAPCPNRLFDVAIVFPSPPPFTNHFFPPNVTGPFPSSTPPHAALSFFSPPTAPLFFSGQANG